MNSIKLNASCFNNVMFLDGKKLDFKSADVNDLLISLQNIASSGFGIEMEVDGSYGIKAVIECSYVSVKYIDKQMVGFAAAEFFPEYRMLNLHGIAIMKKNHLQGIGTELTNSLLNHFKAQKIILTTQSPITYLLINKMCTKIYPTPRENIPENIMNIGIKYMKKRRGLFNPETFIIKDFYPRCLYKNIPISRDEKVNDFFLKSLGINGGATCDGFLIIGEIN